MRPFLRKRILESFALFHPFSYFGVKILIYAYRSISRENIEMSAIRKIDLNGFLFSFYTHARAHVHNPFICSLANKLHTRTHTHKIMREIMYKFCAVFRFSRRKTLFRSCEIFPPKNFLVPISAHSNSSRDRGAKKGCHSPLSSSGTNSIRRMSVRTCLHFRCMSVCTSSHTHIIYIFFSLNHTLFYCLLESDKNRMGGEVSRREGK